MALESQHSLVPEVDLSKDDHTKEANEAENGDTGDQNDTLYTRIGNFYVKYISRFGDAKFIVTHTFSTVLSFVSAYFFAVVVQDYFPKQKRNSKWINGGFGAAFLSLSLVVMYYGGSP